MCSFITSVSSPEPSVVGQAPLVQGRPLFHESDPEALPLPMGTKWTWHEKQARPGLHSASQRPRQAHVSGSWDGALSNPGGSYMNALPDREGTLHACCMKSAAEDSVYMEQRFSFPWRLYHGLQPGSLTEPRKQRELPVRQSWFLFFLSPLTLPCTLFRQCACPYSSSVLPPSWTCCCLLRADSSAQGALPWGAPPPYPTGALPPLHPAGALPPPHPAGALPSAPPSC